MGRVLDHLHSFAVIESFSIFLSIAKYMVSEHIKQMTGKNNRIYVYWIWVPMKGGSKH